MDRNPPQIMNEQGPEGDEIFREGIEKLHREMDLIREKAAMTDVYKNVLDRVPLLSREIRKSRTALEAAIKAGIKAEYESIRGGSKKAKPR